MTRGTLLYVFARAPEAGRVKTRLIPSLGGAGAAALHVALLDDTLAASRDVAERRVLAVAGDPHQPSLVDLAVRESVELTAQCEGDLGARMAGAMVAGLDTGAERVAIIGSDAPL